MKNKLAATTVLGVLAALLYLNPGAQAQAFTVLHHFNGTDGGNPIGGLIRDAAGNLYGTTAIGGGGLGTVFKMNQAGKVTVLYTFSGGADGGFPLGSLLRDSGGNLYGTTAGGGLEDCPVDGFPGYCGTIFKVTNTGAYTLLYQFREDSDGANPGYVKLLKDAKGRLYGTTRDRGPYNGGTVFRLNAPGDLTVLHTFKNDGKGGGQPDAGIIRDREGNFYGTAVCCAAEGTVFKLDTTGKYTVLHYFNGADGAYPDAGLIWDEEGNLYGTTETGGSSGCCGVVFKLTRKTDGSWTERVLHTFTGGKKDGENPIAGLVRDSMGNLYGTTYRGGPSGRGVVFKLDPTDRETVLYSFTGRSDGAHPDAGLIFDPAGNLYGTASSGGKHNNNYCDGGCGVVFKLTP